jgi:hypothetical protein
MESQQRRCRQQRRPLSKKFVFSSGCFVLSFIHGTAPGAPPLARHRNNLQ